MPLTYDTGTIPPPERLAYWRDVICRHHCHIECEPLVVDGFEGRTVVVPLGPAELSVVHSGPVSYRRGRFEIDSRPESQLLVNFTQTSPVLLEQGDVRIVAERGDLFLGDAQVPFRTSFTEAAHNIVLRFPRQFLAERFPDFDGIPMPMSGRGGLGRVLRSMLVERVTYHGCDAEDDVAIFDAALDLLTALLRKDQTPRLPQRCRRDLDRAKRFARVHLCDTTLGAHRVALETGLSIRSLYRLFANDGTTFMRWLMNERLDAAYRTLAGGRGRDVTNVALSHGFKDHSHFSKAFKQRFQRLPKSFLHRNCG